MCCNLPVLSDARNGRNSNAPNQQRLQPASPAPSSVSPTIACRRENEKNCHRETECRAMALRRKLRHRTDTAEGSRIAGSLHTTNQTAVLTKRFTALGAEVRLGPCNIFPTQTHALRGDGGSGQFPVPPTRRKPLNE